MSDKEPHTDDETSSNTPETQLSSPLDEPKKCSTPEKNNTIDKALSTCSTPTSKKSNSRKHKNSQSRKILLTGGGSQNLEKAEKCLNFSVETNEQKTHQSKRNLSFASNASNSTVTAAAASGDHYNSTNQHITSSKSKIKPQQPNQQPLSNQSSTNTPKNTPDQSKKQSQNSEIAQTYERKLFIGGIPSTTSESTLRTYFEKYGPVEDVTLKSSRGFVFITFQNVVDCHKVMGIKTHLIDGKAVDVKKAVYREDMHYPMPYGPSHSQQQIGFGPFPSHYSLPYMYRHPMYHPLHYPSPYYSPYGHYPMSPHFYPGHSYGYGGKDSKIDSPNDHPANSSRNINNPSLDTVQSCSFPAEANKLFVGGLHWKTTNDDLTKYFSKFGVVDDVSIMIDSATQKPRGFGFITFHTETEAKSCLDTKVQHSILDKLVDVKTAVLRNRTSQKSLDQSSHYNHHFPQHILPTGHAAFPNTISHQPHHQPFSPPQNTAALLQNHPPYGRSVTSSGPVKTTKAVSTQVTANTCESNTVPLQTCNDTTTSSTISKNPESTSTPSSSPLPSRSPPAASSPPTTLDCTANTDPETELSKPIDSTDSPVDEMGDNNHVSPEQQNTVTSTTTIAKSKSSLQKQPQSASYQHAPPTAQIPPPQTPQSALLNQQLSIMQMPTLGPNYWGGFHPQHSHQLTYAKIFIGGLKRDTNKMLLEAYFSQYGKVRKLDLVMDPQSDIRNRGFAFVQFESVEACEAACQQQFHTVDGHSVEVKRAVLKPPGTGTEVPGISAGSSYPYTPYNLPLGYAYYPYNYDYYNQTRHNHYNGAWYPPQSSPHVQSSISTNQTYTSPVSQAASSTSTSKVLSAVDENNNDLPITDGAAGGDAVVSACKKITIDCDQQQNNTTINAIGDQKA